MCIAMNTLAGKSAASARRIAISAWMPPADAPITTTSRVSTLCRSGESHILLGTVLHFPQLEAKVGETIRTMQANETRVRGSDGRWYTLRIVPYQTVDRAVRGAVMEFDPVFLSEGAAQQLPELDKMVSEVLSMLPHQVVVLDQDLRIVWLNDAFSKAWEGAAEAWGQRFDVLVPRDEELVELWRAIEGTALAWRPFEDMVSECTIGTRSMGRLRWSGRYLEGESGPLAVITVERLHNLEG